MAFFITFFHIHHLSIRIHQKKRLVFYTYKYANMNFHEKQEKTEEAAFLECLCRSDFSYPPILYFIHIYIYACLFINFWG